MIKELRFGRRMPLPSTLQILHELKVFSELEEGRKKCALQDGLPESASWDDIGLFRAQAERKLVAATPEVSNADVSATASSTSGAESVKS